MTNSNDSHSSESTSSAKPIHKDILNEISMMIESQHLDGILTGRTKPMAYIAHSGDWPLEFWSGMWGENIKNMRRKMKEIGYEPIKFGNTLVVNAEQFWSCLRNNPDIEE